jgi:hypothetical protein
LPFVEFPFGKFKPKDHRTRARKSEAWHGAVITIALAIIPALGRASTGANSAAVRIIRLAPKRMKYGDKKPAAIADRLQRWLNGTPGRKVF